MVHLSIHIINIYDVTIVTMDVQAFPSPQTLNFWTIRFVSLFRHQFGLEFPEANGPLVVLRCVRELLLPSIVSFLFFVRCSFRNTLK